MEINFKDHTERFAFISFLTGQLMYDYNVATGEIEWSGAIEQVTGYNAKTFQKKVDIQRWAELIHPDDRQQALDFLDKALETKTQYHTIYKFRKKDGTYIYIEDIGSFFYDSKGKPVKMLGVMKDVTKDRQAQRMLVRTERLKSIAELSAGVSHNFNNVLQAIMGCANVAMLELQNSNTTAVIDLLKRILDSCNTGARTVSRLQSFSCVKEDYPAPCKDTIDVSQVIEKCIEISQPRWKTLPEKRGVFITVDKSLTKNLIVQMKESDLVEVIVNLINNAVDAMALGGVLTFITYLDKEFNRVAIEVKDTGTGIADVNRSYIFEPFWTTKGKEGTGLGLASSFGIIASYQGAINLESEEGKGTVFRIQLPLAKDAHPEEEFVGTVSLTTLLKILIIDDQEPLAELYAKGLNLLGHDTNFATSGIEGLPIFYTQQPDVVICDLTMPEMNGWQVGRNIQEYTRKHNLPKPLFIMLTGWGVSDEFEEIEKAGIDLILQKPVDLKVLIAEIDRALKERK
jgi:PAS domain S-box-containing protein